MLSWSHRTLDNVGNRHAFTWDCPKISETQPFLMYACGKRVESKLIKLTPVIICPPVLILRKITQPVTIRITNTDTHIDSNKCNFFLVSYKRNK